MTPPPGPPSTPAPKGARGLRLAPTPETAVGRCESPCHPHQEAGMSRQRLPQGQEDGQPQDICLRGNTFLPGLAAALAPRPPGPRAAGGGDRGRNDNPWLEPSAPLQSEQPPGVTLAPGGDTTRAALFPDGSLRLGLGPPPPLPGVRHPFVPPSSVSAAAGWQCGRAHRPPAGQPPQAASGAHPCRPRSAGRSETRAQRRGPASVQPETPGPPAARPPLLLRRSGAAPSLAKPGD